MPDASICYEAFREVLGDKYKLIFANDEECVYSDLMGLKLICSRDKKNIDSETPAEIKEDVPFEGLQVNSGIIETPTEEKTNFDMFVHLREQGYKLKQIYEGELLPLKYNSLKNYNCKLRVA